MTAIDALNIINFIYDFLSDEVVHFLFACGMAYLGWHSTPITSSAIGWVLGKLTRRKINTDAASFILFSRLLVMLSLVLISHALLDGISFFWNRPLGEPLNLH